MSGFQIKTFPAISGDMIARMRASTEKVTDYNVGSVVRALLEAPALEVDELYQAMYYGLLEAIPTAIYTGFGFDLLPAFAASGWVTASRPTAAETPTQIPEGTILTAYDGLTYVVAQDSEIPAGESESDVRVVAVAAGAAGNQAAGAIGQLIGGITYLSQEISAGADAETESQRAERFAAFIRSLARGTVASLEYVSRLAVVYSGSGVAIERVERAALQEGPGHVYMYVHNGSGATSSELVELVQVLVDGYRDNGVWVGGYRPTGMRVDVVAMDDVTIDVEIEVRAAAVHRTEASKMAIAREMAEYIRGIRPGDDVRQVEIRNAALSVDGIEAVTVMAPATNIPGRIDAALGLGTLTVTWTS
ncbi:MAG: hypothetical protein EOM22_03880 [Gammaproteobacteria bacterium]|nr:hypothetical protein [Gammaproteobacteria bacterium]